MTRTTSGCFVTAVVAAGLSVLVATGVLTVKTVTLGAVEAETNLPQHVIAVALAGVAIVAVLVYVYRVGADFKAAAEARAKEQDAVHVARIKAKQEATDLSVPSAEAPPPATAQRGGLRLLAYRAFPLALVVAASVVTAIEAF